MTLTFRKSLLTLLSLILSVTVFAQGNPVSWNSKVEKVTDDTYKLIFQASIAPGYHLYDMGPYDGGPNPTVITFTPDAGYELVGKIEYGSKPIKVQDPMFGMEIGYFESSARFIQVVKVKGGEIAIKANVEWMSCNDEACIPPADEDLTFRIKAPVAAAQSEIASVAALPRNDGKDAASSQNGNDAASSQNGKDAVSSQNGNDAVSSQNGKDAASSQNGNDAVSSQNGKDAVSSQNGKDAASSRTNNADESLRAEGDAISQSSATQLTSAPRNDEGKTPLWSLILQALAWGIAALVTPCVFPMIPMTVSFFMKGSENKAAGRFKASMYGLFIVLLYTVPIAVIILLTWIFGGESVTADIFNWIATHWIPNLIFFIVFMVFAASFFGAFEIVMPSKLVNKSDSKADKKGLGGVFFMALTLVLVSFSCTGPIVGTVLIKSTSGEFWAPILTMLAFSVAFALPFTLFALFPGWLKKLPKSGGWMNTVKVVLGFIEVALGFKFLSTADQTYQWGLLDREIYLAIWIVVFTMLGFYLLGKLKFKFDSPVEHISVLRLTLSIVVFSFVVYMVPGMWGAPLKGLSGYLPPLQTQDYVLNTDNLHTNVVYAPSSGDAMPAKIKYGDSGLELPHGMTGFLDIKEAEAFAEKVDKPLFIDFTGLGCMNCREMEARVLSDKEILSIINEHYVVVSLFGDDKNTKVAEEDWVVTDNGKTLKTLGKINSYYVLKKYGINAQPYYILQGHGKVLVEPRAYDLDVKAFKEFLLKGIEEYKKL